MCIIKKIFSDGHDIGSHTFTHPNITKISSRYINLELNAVQRVLESALGRRTAIFRPPFAKGLNPRTKNEAVSLIEVSQLGYYTVGINIDAHDWRTDNSEEIASQVIEDVLSEKGNIILLHDSGGDRTATIEALPVIISRLQDEGYQFVSRSELLGISKDEIMPILESGKINAKVNFATIKFADFGGADLKLFKTIPPLA